MKDDSVSLLESVTGQWLIDLPGFPEKGILAIFPDKRVIQFCTSVTRPLRSQTTRLWVAADDASHIRFSHTPSQTGWCRGVKLDEDGWTMTGEHEGQKSSFRCVPLPADSVPWWFAEEVVTNLEMIKDA
jgi:hypothetical protein